MQGRGGYHNARKFVAMRGREGYRNAGKGKLWRQIGACLGRAGLRTLRTLHISTLVWRFAQTKFTHQQLQLHTGSMANSPSSQGSWQYTQISRPAPEPGAGAPGPNTSAGTLD